MNIQYTDDYSDCENPADTRLSCFIHTLQLCVRDALKTASHVPKLMKKCKAFGKFSHKSTKVADLLDDLNKILIK